MYNGGIINAIIIILELTGETTLKKFNYVVECPSSLSNELELFVNNTTNVFTEDIGENMYIYEIIKFHIELLHLVIQLQETLFGIKVYGN